MRENSCSHGSIRKGAKLWDASLFPMHRYGLPSPDSLTLSSLESLGWSEISRLGGATDRDGASHRIYWMMPDGRASYSRGSIPRSFARNWFIAQIASCLRGTRGISVGFDSLPRPVSGPNNEGVGVLNRSRT